MLFDDYIQELEFAKGEDVAKMYGRTRGKEARNQLGKDIKKGNRKLKKAERIQNKIDKRLRYSKKHIAPELKQKQLDKAAKLHKKQAGLTKQAEKIYDKTISQKNVQKVLSKKRPQIGRVAALKKWGKLGLAVGAVAGSAYVGNKVYKKIKSRRQEGMTISVQELKNEIIYEILQEENITELGPGIVAVAAKSGRVAKFAGKLGLTPGQLATGTGSTVIGMIAANELTKKRKRDLIKYSPKGGRKRIKEENITEVGAGTVANAAVKGGRFAKFAGHMTPLGIAFDILFIFDLGGMAYKRFFSKAAKACKGTADRKVCIRRYQVGAKQAQAKTLASKIGLCSKHKDPIKCKAKVNRKIASLKSDIEFLRREL